MLLFVNYQHFTPVAALNTLVETVSFDRNVCSGLPEPGFSKMFDVFQMIS